MAMGSWLLYYEERVTAVKTEHSEQSSLHTVVICHMLYTRCLRPQKRQHRPYTPPPSSTIPYYGISKGINYTRLDEGGGGSYLSVCVLRGFVILFHPPRNSLPAVRIECTLSAPCHSFLFDTALVCLSHLYGIITFFDYILYIKTALLPI